MMFVGGSYASLTYFGTRPSERTQIWEACADRYSHLKKMLTHPTPGGFRGLSIDCLKSFATDRAQSWHACADRYSHLTFFLTHPTRGAGRFMGLSIVKNLSQQTAPKFGTHVRIDTITLKKIDPPHPRGV